MKRAQLGIEAVFAYFIFVIAIILALAIILFPGSVKGKAQEAISGISLDQENYAELELTAYLRTPLPDDLPDKIAELKNRKLDVKIKPDLAKSYLQKNPELYIGRTYGDFLAMMCSLDKPDQNVMDSVGRAILATSIDGKAYDYPRISVVYSGKKGYCLQGGNPASGTKSQIIIAVEQPLPLYGTKLATVTMKKRVNR